MKYRKYVFITKVYIVIAAAAEYAMFNFASRIRHLGQYLISPYGFRSLIIGFIDLGHFVGNFKTITNILNSY